MSDRPPATRKEISLLQGMRGRCPRCQRGKLFTGILKLLPACTECDLDYAAFDTADGPAVFAITGVGFVVVAAVLILEIMVQPPIWLHLLIWLPLATLLCIAVLRPLKSLLVYLEFANNAQEGVWQQRSGKN